MAALTQVAGRLLSAGAIGDYRAGCIVPAWVRTTRARSGVGNGPTDSLVEVDAAESVVDPAVRGRRLGGDVLILRSARRYYGWCFALTAPGETT